MEDGEDEYTLSLMGDGESDVTHHSDSKSDIMTSTDADRIPVSKVRSFVDDLDEIVNGCGLVGDQMTDVVNRVDEFEGVIEQYE